MSFTNKVVVISGAASGIGEAMALSFAKLNASVCIIDMNEKNLLKIKEKCKEVTKSKVFEIVADLCKEDVRKVVKSALKELKKIDILINCAGILEYGNIHDEDILEKYDRVMSVNLRAMIALTRQALPALIESQGCIINMSSIASTIMSRNTLVYNISKAGVTNFTKCAAFELAPQGVRVNCISPGPVRTNLLTNAGSSESDQTKFWDKLAEITPLNTCVKPEEVAALAVYLASDNALSITGSDFVVDGGMTLRGTSDVLGSAANKD
ncbi:dehydrogenase/reductase SDR family member 6-like [Epargyreus clarus]|uniref:dehydrogenase/reductase SDR family member 6-like n=1 Tax=Epargyreus clarus TaxID=520877 RepID=UPI003C30A943